MRSVVLSFMVIIGLFLLTTSCQKSEDELPTIVGVWKATDKDDRTDYYKLILNADHTFSLRVDLSIPNNPIDFDYTLGTYEYKNLDGKSYLFLNYPMDGDIVQRTLLVISISNSEMVTSSFYADSNNLFWTREK